MGLGEFVGQTGQDEPAAPAAISGMFDAGDGRARTPQAKAGRPSRGTHPKRWTAMDATTISQQHNPFPSDLGASFEGMVLSGGCRTRRQRDSSPRSQRPPQVTSLAARRTPRPTIHALVRNSPTYPFLGERQLSTSPCARNALAREILESLSNHRFIEPHRIESGPARRNEDRRAAHPTAATTKPRVIPAG
jgi:hypothetical protein